MASREKKLTANKKQMTDAASLLQKESTITTTISQNEAGNKVIRKRKINPAKKVTKRVGKNMLALNLKAKDKTPQISKKIVKVLLNNIDAKKNGVALPAKRIVKKKPESTSVPTEHVSVEKKTKKGTNNTTPKLVKTDHSESLSKIDDTIDSILKQIMLDEEIAETIKIKKPRVKKLKVETVVTPKVPGVEPIKQRDTVAETIEDVMNDLVYLLKDEEINNTSVVDRKHKEEVPERPLILENNITIDASAKHLIDMLDLSVSKGQELETSSDACVRRHSIEKLSDPHNLTPVTNVSRTNNASKSIRTSKHRSSVDGVVKRCSPYNTRSDHPTPKLRNGKSRKMKETLLEGIPNTKKRRKRLDSEHIASERCKASGYESDSSYSDLSSNFDNKNDIKVSIVNGIEDDVKSEDLMDDNSNLYSNLNDATELNNIIATNPSPKVPEKSILLDIMKQAFNDKNTDQENNDQNETIVVTTEQFYGSNSKSDEEKDFESKSKISVAEIKLETSDAEEEGVPENAVDTKDDILLQSPNPNSQCVTEEEILQCTVQEIINSMEEQDFTESIELVVENKGDELKTVEYVPKKDEFKTAEHVPKEDELKATEHVPKEDELKATEHVPNEDELKVTEYVPTEDELKTTEHASKEDELETTEHAPKEDELKTTEHALKEDELKTIEHALKEDELKTTEHTPIEDEPKTTEHAPEDELKTPQPVPKEDEHVPKEEPKTAEKTLIESSDVVETPEVNDVIVECHDIELHKIEGTVIESNDIEHPKPEESAVASDVVEPSKIEVMESTYDETDQNFDENLNENIIEEKLSNELQLFDGSTAKESILQALGLQSLKAVEEAKKDKLLNPDYTGSLKAVIKLNRIDKNKRRHILKFPAYKYEVDVPDLPKFKETSSSSTWKVQNQSAQSSDTAGAPRKYHNSNRINMDGSSEHNSDGDTTITENDDPYKVLVIPEKASSFSVHPGRLCKDECTYCFGKFGLFDTPCHIAQMKSAERQNKILEAEKHLTSDSCLCDACYRHVDRKSNSPSYLNKGSKRNSIIAPGPRQNHCHVLSCTSVASHILRRKWIIKMRKSVSKLINIDLDNLGLHSIPICDEHYAAVEHLMICAMCKRRLTRNQVHYLGPETNDLNSALNASGIPVTLIDKPVVCKLCRYFASLILRPADDRPENTINFFRDYRRRLLHFHNIEVMDEVVEEEEETILLKDKSDKEIPTKKRKRLQPKSTNNIGPPILEPQVDLERLEQPRSAHSESNSTGKSRSESPSDYMLDYNTLIPSIAMDCGSDPETTKKTTSFKNKSVRLSSNSSVSVRELFPGEEQLGLQCHIDFASTKEKTPEGWDRCNSVIQYDQETKLLWQELQKPYGNPSSFLRHLVLLEKYFRNGDLILASNASHNSINYSESVQNRLRAYDNIPKSSFSPINHTTTGTVTTKDTSIINAANIPKNTPITITQINNIVPTVVNKTRIPPPGLISLHPGTSRPKTPALVRTPHTSKIKIPITHNWRPNLIPVDPTTTSDSKPGHVKVVSNSKSFFITIDDYNRMCAIKKSYDLKQKRLLEASQTPTLKNITVRKGSVLSPTKVESELENHTEKSTEILEVKSPGSTVMILPRIPKSLTVIPQSVQKTSPPPLTLNSPTNKL